MKIWTSQHVFQHPWETVVQAAWQKYPNPLSPSVVSVDVIERKSSRGVLTSHRLMGTQWGLPDWAAMLIGINRTCYVSEHSRVDPKRKIMQLNSRNLTFCNFVTIDEQLVYSRHPDNHKHTLLKQDTVIKVQGVPLTSYMENIVLGTCSGNAAKGRQGLEWVINHIKAEAESMMEKAHKGMDNVLPQTSNTST